MRIGILGSAFDPPHKAHVKLGERAKKALKLDFLILVPTKTPPHKANPVAPARFRLRMAKILADKRKGWIVSDVELRRPGKSYTRDTIRYMKKRYPNDEIYWIVGSDSIVSMPWKWKGGYDILDYCKFAVAERPGYPLKGVSRHILKKLVIIPAQSTDLSSTKIRNLLGQGKSVRRFLDQSIYALVKRHNLYS